MSERGQRLKPATRWSDHAPNSWGPYWDAMFGSSGMVTPWINWKRGSTGVNIARMYWYEREYLRRVHESVYGSDPTEWPSQHPGVVLGDRAACLRCHYFDTQRGALSALDSARRHETSGGEFRGGRQHRRPADSEAVPTPREQQRRTPIPALRIAERYAAGRNRPPE